MTVLKAYIDAVTHTVLTNLVPMLSDVEARNGALSVEAQKLGLAN